MILANQMEKWKPYMDIRVTYCFGSKREVLDGSTIVQWLDTDHKDYPEGAAMPRMSKKRKEEWAFLLNDRNRITCNPLCRKCRRPCKQSFRTIIIDCPPFISKRSRLEK